MDYHHVSLQSSLLALTLVEWESQSGLRAEPHRLSAQDKDDLARVLLMSAVCSQVFLAVCISVEFLSSLPSPAGAALPILNALQA